MKSKKILSGRSGSVVVILIAVISLVLGVWGTLLGKFQINGSISFSDIPDAVYYTVRLYLFMPPDAEVNNILFEIAKWTSPLCTLLVIWMLLECRLREVFLLLFMPLRRHKNIVFGYNNLSRIYTFNLTSNNKSVVLFTESEVSDDDRLELARAGIVLIKGRIYNASSKQIRKYMTLIGAASAESATFMFNEDSRNFDAFTNFCRYIDDNHMHDNHSKPNNIIKCSMRCSNNTMRQLSAQSYDMMRNNNWNGRIDFRTFDLSEVAVRTVFRRIPLHTYNFLMAERDIKPEHGSVWDVRLAIIGFNTLGCDVLIQAINAGVNRYGQ